MKDRWREEDEEAAVAECFGANVACLRLARGLSQTDLGERAAIHRNDVSLIEVGRRRPRIDILLQIAAGLGIEPETLLDGIAWVKADAAGGRFEVEEGEREPAPDLATHHRDRQAVGQNQDREDEQGTQAKQLR